MVLILELLMFMVEHHTYNIKNHILHRDTLKRALTLVQSRHTFLALAALRLLRKIIGKADEAYNTMIVKVRIKFEILGVPAAGGLEGPPVINFVKKSCLFSAGYVPADYRNFE